MTRTVRLNRSRRLLDELSYPIDREDAREALADVVLEYADGEEPLADVLARSNQDRFESPEDLHLEVYNNLPTEAVGEPGQSEGEG